MRRLYVKDFMGAPPAIPDAIETGITAYLSRQVAEAAADETEVAAAPGVVLLELH